MVVIGFHADDMEQIIVEDAAVLAVHHCGVPTRGFLLGELRGV